MTDQTGAPAAIQPATWIRVTTIGWFIGFLFMLVLIFIADVTGATGQWMVGIGVGAGLGYWQSRMLRGVLERPAMWAVATAVGLGAPFVFWDLSAVVGAGIRFSLWPTVAAGGLMVALWQWRLLRPLSERAPLWLVVCTVGWMLPAIATSMSDGEWVGEPWATGFSLLGMFFGGAMLGAVTGKPLAWILEARQHPV